LVGWLTLIYIPFVAAALIPEKGVSGGHDEVLESEELAEFVHEMIFRGK